MINYFAAINAGRVVLWNYLFWYLSVLIQHFDSRPRLWLTSIGISAIVGVALVLSTTSSWSAFTRTDRWQVFRLFLMPFCVSSFAALVKDKEFVLIFSSRLSENLPGILACIGFTSGVMLLKLCKADRVANAVVNGK